MYHVVTSRTGMSVPLLIRLVETDDCIMIQVGYSDLSPSWKVLLFLAGKHSRMSLNCLRKHSVAKTLFAFLSRKFVILFIFKLEMFNAQALTRQKYQTRCLSSMARSILLRFIFFFLLLSFLHLSDFYTLFSNYESLCYHLRLLAAQQSLLLSCGQSRAR